MRAEWVIPPLVASFFTPEISVAYIGVPLNVIVACILGAYSSFSVGEKVEPRRRMFNLFVACVFMGAAFTAICNAGISHWLEMDMTAGLQAGVGAAVSFITRFFLPWLADVVSQGKWLSWIPFFRKSGE